MPRRLLTCWVGIISVVTIFSVSACGSTTHVTGPSVPKFRPAKATVTTNPTAAQSFIYLPRSTVQEANGDILIADGGDWDRSGAKVVEMNPQGKVIWVYSGGLVFPHAAYPVGNNDILISDTGNDRVIIINRQGKTVWSTDNLGGGKGFLGQGSFEVNGKKTHLLYPNDAVMEPGNNVLITSRYTNAVYEINTKTGKVTWSCSKFMNKEHNARLISSGPYKGDLMVANSDDANVLIINHSCTGPPLFKYGPINFFGQATIEWPRSFQQYPGGNYIIGDSRHSRIIEINSQKKVIQTWNNLPAPFYVTVLPNGDLLTQDSNIHGAVVLSPSGGIVKEYPTTNPTTYPSSVVNPSFEKGQGGWLQGDLLTESLPAHVRADMAFDSSTAHTGKSSGRITWPTNTSHLALDWYQNISVTPGQTYHFTGYIKTSKVQTCNGCDYGVGSGGPAGVAQFVVDFFDPSQPLNPSPSALVVGNPASGTTGWTKETASVTVPSGVTQLQIQCQLQGRGTVWFDDVTVAH